jgi:MATE family multidrug resistance protein
VHVLGEVRRLVELAWPVVVGQLGLVAMGVVDLAVAGSLGETAMAAVGLGHTWSFASLVFGMGVVSGIDPQTTRAYGAGRAADAGRVALHGLVLAAVVSIGILAAHVVAGPVLMGLSQPDDAVPLAATYCWILTAGVWPFLGFSLVRQLLQAGGSMRPATTVVLVANVVNLVADVALVHGFEQGVAGLAWATVIVRWFMLAALVWIGWPILRKARPDGWFTGFELRRVANLVPIALPVGFQLGFEVWAFNLATLLAGTLGETAVAAHTTALSATSLAFMVPLGLGAAATTRVGNAVGAAAPWKPAGAVAIAMGAGCMVVSGAAFLGVPESIAGLYTDERAVIGLAASILPVAAAFGVFDGTQVVAMGVLRGLGDTRFAAGIALFAYWAVGLPVSLYAVTRLELFGIWVGLSVGLGTSAVLCVLRVVWLGARDHVPVLDG